MTKSERGLIILVLGEFFYITALYILNFSLAIWLFQQYSSVFFIALSVILITLASLVVQPYAGILADYAERKNVLLKAWLAFYGLAFILYFFWTIDYFNIWIVWSFNIMLAAIRGLIYPVLLTIVPDMVEKKNLKRFNGILVMIGGGIEIMIPVVGAWAYSSIGLDTIIFYNLFAGIPLLIALCYVRIPSHQKVDASGKVNIAQKIKDLLFVIKKSTVLKIILLSRALVAGIISAVSIFILPILLTVGDVTDAGLGRTVVGCSFIMAGLLIFFQRKNYSVKREVTTIILCNIIGGSCLLFLPFVHSVWGYVLIAFCVINILIMGGIVENAILQGEQLEEYRGRIFAVRNMMNQVMTIVFVLSVSVIADYIFKPLMETSWSLLLLGQGDVRPYVTMVFVLGLFLVVFMGYFLRLLLVQQSQDIIKLGVQDGNKES